MTPHQTPPSVPTDEMVEAFLNEMLRHPDDASWKEGVEPHEIENLRKSVKAALTAALAAMPGGVDVKPLDWQTTYVDRGDGQKEESGWEADNGFNQWYSVEMYFGTDSYGWQVKFDCDVIADHDDPERAKAAAQEHFASRILSRLNTSAIGAEGWKLVPEKPTDEMVTAGWEVKENSGTPRNIYQAMLAAAPSPPTTAQEGK